MTAPDHLTIDDLVSKLGELTSFDMPQGVNPYDSLLDDLGIDSIQVYELIVLVEVLAGCDVPPPAIPEVRTLADAYDYYWTCKRALGD